jgi:8-oxo-dGTP pyrophosphatase MutT (NUDIX family)
MDNKSKTVLKPRPASTIILVRELNTELQVYLLKRSAKSGFMAGNYVFPGGTLEEQDRHREFWQRHVDLNFEETIQRLGGSLTAKDVVAYGVAAIRETLEEAGVFLAQRKGQSKSDIERICQLRITEAQTDNWFFDLISSENWILQFSKLAPWAHWITPQGMPKLFDTRFFLAFMPSVQTCVPDARETTHGAWITPEKGLQGNLSGEMPLSPPIVVTLHQLLKYSNLQELEADLTDRDWGETLAPRLVSTKKGPVILEPWDPEWGQEDITIDLDLLPSQTLPVGQSFSRVWMNRGIWRPVKV